MKRLFFTRITTVPPGFLTIFNIVRKSVSREHPARGDDDEREVLGIFRNVDARPGSFSSSASPMTRSRRFAISAMRLTCPRDLNRGFASIGLSSTAVPNSHVSASRPTNAPVAQWIEQPPPKGQVARSIRVRGATIQMLSAREK